MKTYVSLLLALLLSTSLSYPLQAQDPSEQDQDEVLRVRTNEVKLDVVVKDKKGRPVRNLKDSDFEIYEDGNRQKIQSFRFVAREVSNVLSPERKDDPSAPAQPSEAARNTSTPGVIALVFDRLSPEARSLARKAGMAYAQEGMAGGDFTGVFGIDQSLRTLQSFTDNPARVKEAIDRATSGSTSTYASSSAKVRDMADQSIGLDRQIASGQAAASAAGAAGDSAGAAAAGAAIGQAAMDQKFIEMQTSMLEQFQVLERDQQGFATINSLLAVINPMRRLPGRKTLIFFSEGLSLPSSVQMKFPAVISAANKANVSIYAIDSAGLRIESGTSEAAREINSLAARRMQQVGRGSESGTSGPYTKALERNEDLLRLDPRSGLGVLADETGGFLIHSTNDLASGLRRINDDMRGYYLITYAPTNNDYDGRFRQITLKLSHANFDVQTRKGYYAIDSVGQLPVLDYEAPALAAAAQSVGAKSNPFSLRSGALSFPATNRPGLALVLAEAPVAAFTLGPAGDKKIYSADFSIVCLIKDQSGQVVQKLSQHYPLSGPIDNLDATRKTEVLFYRETQLPPGRYTVQLIAYDGPTGRVGVRTTALEVPNIDDGKLRMSSVAVLKRAERLNLGEQGRNQPLQFGELLVYPNLGEPVVRSVAKQLAFFLTAWPAKGSSTPPQLMVEILQNNRRLGQTSNELPAVDQHGQIKYASSFPLDKFPPGAYELKVTVSDGQNSASRSTRFTVAP